MAENDVEGGELPARRWRAVEEEATVADVHGVAMKLERAKEVYREYGGIQDKPNKGEVMAWCLYGLSSYFIQTLLIPLVFPLLISQISKAPTPEQGWDKSFKAKSCTKMEEMQVYQGLTYRSINIKNLNFSALEWTSISWFTGLILSAPILAIISIDLDYAQHPQILAGAATALGAISCLPAGFFKTPWIFPPYIAAITTAATIGTASHTRHLGLMLRGFISSTIHKSEFNSRRRIASWLSLYATVAGCLGSAIFATFTYRMLRGPDKFISLWIVIIFSGLMWLIGLIIHIFTTNRPSENTKTALNSVPKTHVFSIFSHPHAAGSLVGVFLSSLATMCIFTGGVLFLVGQICLKPLEIFFTLLAYFIFPILSLPLLLHPLQQLIRADALKMQLLGFILSALTTGFGFCFRDKNWQNHQVLVFTAVQSTAAGVLHGFGRVLLVDCSPAGKEGVFSVWFSWVRALGICGGFAVATAGGGGGDISRPFGVAFCGCIVGVVVLIFGNISNFGGAIAAGNVREDSRKSSTLMHDFDDNYEGR